MGWNPFSSEEVTRVATSVSRVIPDDMLPNSINTGAIKGIFHEGNITNYVMEELVASIGVKAERMYAYAEKHYEYGLPSGEIYSSTQGRTQVEDVIETMEGQQVFMEYSHYGSLNALHVGWTKLVANHGYHQSTNQLANLTAQKGTPVYLQDMVVMAPAGTMRTGSMEQWGTAACAGVTPTRQSSLGGLVQMATPTPVHVNSALTEPELLVTYIWKVGKDNFLGTFTINLSGYDQAANYFQAKYILNGEAKYWSYLNDSGVHPSLDAVYTEAPFESGSYFPFAYFRFNKHSSITDKTTASYKTTKKLVKYLGMDYDIVGEAIDENPNIGDVEQAMLIMAVPAVSSVAIENRYLFDYFDNQHAALGESDPTVASILNAISSMGGLFGSLADQFGSSNVTVIQDKRFKMTLGNNGIFKRLVAGTIGDVGSYSSQYTTLNIERELIDAETLVSTTEVTPMNCHTYRHQITVGVYEEIAVLGLRMTYNVYGGYNTVGDETDEILLIPIDKAVSVNYTIPDREILYARSLHMIFNSRTVQEVKWYQQEWFQVVMIVVAIVLTVMDWGADGGAWITAATGLTGYSLLIAMIVINLVIGMALMPKIYALFVKVLGQDAATVLVILMIIYGAYQISQGGLAGCPWASQLLSMSSGITQAVINSKMVDVLGEYDQFKIFVEEETKLLDTANDLLHKTTLLSPFTIYGEKPEDFYNRTVHFGNIGTVGINAISSYVDIALTLPKLNDTLGEEFNAPL